MGTLWEWNTARVHFGNGTLQDYNWEWNTARLQLGMEHRKITTGNGKGPTKSRNGETGNGKQGKFILGCC